MINTLIVLTAVALLLLLTLGKAFRTSQWAATVTPLASIMGSGFLISAPLLSGVVGNSSPLVMAALLLVAWCLGGAIRFNILNAESLVETDETIEHKSHTGHAQTAAMAINRIEQLSHLILAMAYFISVTYYIQLLCKFSLHSIGINDLTTARILGTFLLIAISATGYLFGLKIIEKVEGYAIDLNLSMIGALIAGLIFHNLLLWNSGEWILPKMDKQPEFWSAVRICMGLLVVVQGFETSRFLGSEHSAQQRVQTMRWAQGLASVIYIVFLTLMLVVNTPEQASQNANVTAIITLVSSVALVLPFMLTVAAVGSQFSAAVADEAGCGGLLSHLGNKFLDNRTAYLVIGVITVSLTWWVDIKQIISLASRAFAAFYFLQCVVAATVAYKKNQTYGRAAWFGLLAMVALAITVFGMASE